MSEWELVRLGDVTSQIQDVVKVAPGVEYPLLGVRWYAAGPFLREVVTSDNSKATRFYRAQPGQFIYNRMFAWKGSFGLVNADLDGSYVSNEFPLFECDARLMPEFLKLHFGQPSVWAAIERVSTGTTASRNRWKESQFGEYQVALPSRAEQRRIVDIIAALDAHIDGLAREVAKARHLLRCLLADHFESVAGDEIPIVDLCAHVIGGIWGSPEGESEVDVLALGPRIYSPGTADFVTDGSPMRSFSRKQVEPRQVQPNDIVLERSGGSPEQPVGRVVIAGEGLPPCVPTDFQRLIRPDAEKIDPRYLFWRLQHDWNSGITRAFSRRTTGITNLSVKEYIARQVPVPDHAVQAMVISSFNAVALSIDAAEAERICLRNFRSSILAALLNQEIEIPESYDALLEAMS
ncbi:hypothetical protein [Kribbella solani]|uniref:Type I restriction enzyme S subunit n=1 Tax=Kribbella solani TaxID=236067 RepID=A0A841E223_9ACTN|nr:hypothetical protein [Kribbella solani]MBB5982457.1 type I restriction enzyme S subunit [Kribbella solani]